MDNRVDNLGIKPRSKESELLQQFGEGRISLDELKKASPTKWQNIVSAKDYFRREYDTLLDQWNRARGEAGRRADEAVFCGGWRWREAHRW